MNLPPSTITPLAAGEFEKYLALLRWLADEPTPFTEPARVAAMMGRVRERMRAWLPGHACEVDAAGNLVCVPRAGGTGGGRLYLSAHLDTVPGEPELWTPPFAPWPTFENERELVGQGVNDCKAGVAAQLWLAQLAAEGAVALRDVVFLVSAKEEGAGAKSGVELGRALGGAIPGPTPGSTLLVLENTVGPAAPHTPQVFAAESSSYVVRLTGALPELRAALRALAEWRPVAIAPAEAAGAAWAWTRHAPLGHVCSAPPEANPLRAALLAAGEHELMCAGDGRTTGTVPAAIGRARSATARAAHWLTLTKRGDFPLAAVRAELAGREYAPLKPLELSEGFDATGRVGEAAVGRGLAELAREGAVVFDRNPGASDASIITAAMPAEWRRNLVPLVCGPGTRSQRGATPPRLTHGPNETFVKAAGANALAVLREAWRRAGHVT